MLTSICKTSVIISGSRQNKMQRIRLIIVFLLKRYAFCCTYFSAKYTEKQSGNSRRIREIILGLADDNFVTFIFTQESYIPVIMIFIEMNQKFNADKNMQERKGYENITL